MAYKQIANVFGPLMVDEDTGALLVDAGGFVIEADIIDADINAITGTAPNDADLHDIHSDLFDGSDTVISAITGPIGPNAFWSMGGHSIADLLESLVTGYDIPSPLLAGGNGSSAADILWDLTTGQGSFIGAPGGLHDWASGYSVADWLADLTGRAGPAGSSPLYDQMSGYGIADWLENMTNNSGSVGASSPLFTSSAGMKMADVLGFNYFEGSVSQMDWSALSAPGVTSSHDTSPCWHGNHTMAVTVANVDTNVVVRLEGSFDGANWFNLAEDGSDLTITADGTYAIFSRVHARYVRGRFVSESGGTNATVTFQYRGRIGT